MRVQWLEEDDTKEWSTKDEMYTRSTQEYQNDDQSGWPTVATTFGNIKPNMKQKN